MMSRAIAYSRHHPMTDEHFTFVENDSERVLAKHSLSPGALTRRD
jgi:hypothetical protein